MYVRYERFGLFRLDSEWSGVFRAREDGETAGSKIRTTKIRSYVRTHNRNRSECFDSSWAVGFIARANSTSGSKIRFRSYGT